MSQLRMVPSTLLRAEVGWMYDGRQDRWWLHGYRLVDGETDDLLALGTVLDLDASPEQDNERVLALLRLFARDHGGPF